MTATTSRAVRWLKRGALGFVVAIVLLLAYGLVVERFFVLESGPPVDAEVPNLPPSWEGKRVGVIADIHVGMWLGNTSMIRRAVAELVRQRPDVVLMAGDFVVGARAEGERSDRIEEAMAILRPLVDAKIPVLGVLGNHDYSIFSHGDHVDAVLADEVAAAATRTGVFMLRNESHVIALDGGAPLFFVGLDSRWADRDVPAQAFASLPEDAARVVFMHNPESFPPIARGAAPFAIAAHTHGGDIRVPLLGHWSWIALVQGKKVPSDGWALPGYGADGNHLYVNRGVGNSTAPIRINDAPEISVFVLHRAR